MVDLQLWHIGSDSKPPAMMGDLRLVNLPVSLLCFFCRRGGLCGSINNNLSKSTNLPFLILFLSLFLIGGAQDIEDGGVESAQRILLLSLW